VRILISLALATKLLSVARHPSESDAGLLPQGKQPNAMPLQRFEAETEEAPRACSARCTLSLRQAI